MQKLQLNIVDSTKKSSWVHCVVTLFKTKVISTVNVKYAFASLQNTVWYFVEMWNTYTVLCKVKK